VPGFAINPLSNETESVGSRCVIPTALMNRKAPVPGPFAKVALQGRRDFVGRTLSALS
jgi:hypothetical protein